MLTSSSETPDDIGHSVVVAEDLVDTLMGYHLMRFRPFSHLDFHFEKYMFGSHYMRQWFAFRATGMTRYGLSYSDFSNAMVLIPPLVEQQKLSHFLDSKCAQIDVIIEQQQAVIEKLKEYKQSVITEAVTKGLNPDAPMKDSSVEWIGMMPEHWVKARLGRFILATGNGLTRRSVDAENIGNIVLRIKEISNGTIDYSEPNRIRLTENELASYTLNDGELLFVRVNGSRSLVGKSAVFHSYFEPVAYNDHIIRVNIGETLCVDYVHWYLQCDAGKKEIDKHLNTAAGQFTISGSDVRSISIIFPGRFEQQEIVNYLNKKSKNIDNAIEKKGQLIDKLTNYRKSLIYEAVTGKLEV